MMNYCHKTLTLLSGKALNDFGLVLWKKELRTDAVHSARLCNKKPAGIKLFSRESNDCSLVIYPSNTA